MKPAVKLKLDGKPFSLHSASPSLVLIKKFLASAPKDEIFSASELSRKVGIHVCTIRHSATEEELSPYTATHARTRYFGHPEAIRLLKEQLEAEQ